MRQTANVVFHLHRGAIYVRLNETKGFPYNMNIFCFLDMTKNNDENDDDDDGDDKLFTLLFSITITLGLK